MSKTTKKKPASFEDKLYRVPVCGTMEVGSELDYGITLYSVIVYEGSYFTPGLWKRTAKVVPRGFTVTIKRNQRPRNFVVVSSWKTPVKGKVR